MAGIMENVRQPGINSSSVNVRSALPGSGTSLSSACVCSPAANGAFCASQGMLLARSAAQRRDAELHALLSQPLT